MADVAPELRTVGVLGAERRLVALATVSHRTVVAGRSRAVTADPTAYHVVNKVVIALPSVKMDVAIVETALGL
jgi:hypothetical protein